MVSSPVLSNAADNNTDRPSIPSTIDAACGDDEPNTTLLSSTENEGNSDTITTNRQQGIYNIKIYKSDVVSNFYLFFHYFIYMAFIVP